MYIYTDGQFSFVRADMFPANHFLSTSNLLQLHLLVRANNCRTDCRWVAPTNFGLNASVIQRPMLRGAVALFSRPLFEGYVQNFS